MKEHTMNPLKRPMRRNDRQQDEKFARALLEQCEYAVLSMVGPDNEPYAIPISPVLEGDFVYFHSATEGTKLDYIAKNPQVSLVCVGKTQLLPEKFSTNYESAIAFGKASRITDANEIRNALILISQKFAPSNMEAAPAYIESAIDEVAVIRIHLQGLTAKARFSKEKNL
jgi:uncharacterized protein